MSIEEERRAIWDRFAVTCPCGRPKPPIGMMGSRAGVTCACGRMYNTEVDVWQLLERIDDLERRVKKLEERK